MIRNSMLVLLAIFIIFKFSTHGWGNETCLTGHDIDATIAKHMQETTDPQPLKGN